MKQIETLYKIIFLAIFISLAACSSGESEGNNSQSGKQVSSEPQENITTQAPEKDIDVVARAKKYGEIQAFYSAVQVSCKAKGDYPIFQEMIDKTSMQAACMGPEIMFNPQANQMASMCSQNYDLSSPRISEIQSKYTVKPNLTSTEKINYDMVMQMVETYKKANMPTESLYEPLASHGIVTLQETSTELCSDLAQKAEQEYKTL